nr:hypothetical protein [Rhodoferax sp.]
MRTADLIVSRRIRVYKRGGAVRAGGTTIAGLAVVVPDRGRACQRWPLRVPVAPRYSVGNIYDRWNRA